jgi:hypothetical protein
MGLVARKNYQVLIHRTKIGVLSVFFSVILAIIIVTNNIFVVISLALEMVISITGSLAEVINTVRS